uniref:Retinoic acid-inducible protein I n=1 Tax=Dugesia japonica TaxID=6161 RepID=A0A344X4E4_DUGJA|nr:retinoic acid-inducible protein I [Dugesia japonica]
MSKDIEDNWKIKRNFDKFKNLIETCLLEKDIIFYMVPLRELFNDKERKYIEESPSNEKVNHFLKCFNDLKNTSKYSYFRNAVVETHKNQWIHTFLTVDINDQDECTALENKWKVLQNTLNLLQHDIESIHIDEEFVHYLYSQEVISQAHKEYIIASILHKGSSTAIRELFNVVSMKSLNWYGHLLYIISKQKCNFIHKFLDELGPIDNYSNEEKLQKCLEYANNYIQSQIPQVENPKLKKSDDANIVILMDYNEISDSVEKDDVTRVEKDSSKYELKEFQVELCEKAMNKTNVIIYAPTGSGKTNIAVSITNHHLENNRSGKVAFLVHRIPLVIQQFKVFQKFKNPEFNVVSIRGKSDDNSGPLISHLKDNNIFVMTSDLLLNALTIDDGNKISSISEFSLIFFDECHNCTNSHPYTRIMKLYFKEKKKKSNNLPQIIGLTASPKSNKKDDIKGITESLLQLCACLDCLEISKVTKNKKELEGFISKPEQEPHLVGKREMDHFEEVLLEQIAYCEEKFKKMKNEKYFSFNAFREIPDDKFHESYANFVGSLKHLVTVTIDENDGKQKTYSIYRFLNAFYRGLIVNQMFNKQCAMKTIKNHLKHNGVDFTCYFDEVFYKRYEENILNRKHRQSDNPAIKVITDKIIEQIQKPDSRVLIFVREIDFTFYLVHILMNINESIKAEAIVGSSAKTELKGNDDHVLSRFHNGSTRVLVATTVVEEGLNVALCNMVISYGHVTNEISMVQRMGRLRAADSKYILVLPPMLHWLEKKEKLNEHRRNRMMESIEVFEKGDPNERRLKIEEFQNQYYCETANKINNTVESKPWKFTCRSCQTEICTSDDLRLLDGCHRICMNPKLLKKFTIREEENKCYGAQKSYKNAGKVFCFGCKNHQLGSYIYYRENPFFQLKIDCCSTTNSDGDMMHFKSWRTFTFSLKNLNSAELENYCSQLNALTNNII